MNKQAIWIIIGLMSAAVFGVVWLQMDLIGTSIRVNEAKFDENVFEALNKVVERMESEEQREQFHSMNGFARDYYRSETFGQRNATASLSLDFSFRSSGNNLKSTQLIDKLMADLSVPCTNCIVERDQNYRRMMMYYNSSMANFPIVERLKLDPLKAAIQQELSNRGINTDYSYGVYSKNKKSFVIVNGHYVVEDDQPRETLPGYRNIFNSKYKVHLFPREMPAPGLLMVHFPSRTSFVWSSVWLSFLGSILFTGVILFCFGYTIYVIFQQKKLSEMKTDFINNMTHEFKTPIATISLAADSITSPMISGSPSKVERFAGIIKQENRRMNSQVEKVLQMALLDKKDFTMKLSPVNLHDVVYNAVENISLIVEKREGTAKAVLEASNPMVEGDLTHISNIINNLLDNANKYSPENPEISVHTRNVPNGVEVIVKDKGIGMSKDARKHIFDKFYRVHTGDLHDVKGFGLGLSYVKAIITAHKGQIDVKSDLGKGSSFILFFPFHVQN